MTLIFDGNDSHFLTALAERILGNGEELKIWWFAPTWLSLPLQMHIRSIYD